MDTCPVKILFPTFGSLNDPSDPLQYLERCTDFLALNPLTDEELIATIRNILHGTARDWWDVALHKIHTWKQFQEHFRAAFLSEDYEDELAERVRNRVQTEGESVRDFAYMYQALCKRWKSDIEEEEIIKLILKNINPQLASQLRSSRVTSVDALVRLGQQLEMDRENQLHYKQRKNLKKSPKSAASDPTVLAPNRENPVRQNQPGPNRPPQVYCLRCKGSHAPESCPQLHSNRVSSSPRPQQQHPDKSSYHQESHARLGSLVPQSHSGTVISVFPSANTLPCQPLVPLSVGPWKGTAILDTGSSYTLISDSVWSGVKWQQDVLKLWTRGPL